MVHGRHPYFRAFHPFGTEVVFLNQEPGRNKFDPKGLRGRLVGLNDDVFGFWQPGTKKTTTTKHVTFLKPSPFAIKGTVNTQDNMSDGSYGKIFEDKSSNASVENAEQGNANNGEQAATRSQNDDINSAPVQGENENKQPQRVQERAVRPKSNQQQAEQQRFSAPEHGQLHSSDQPAAQQQVVEKETSQSDAAVPSTSQALPDADTESQVSSKKKKRKRKKYVANQERLDALRKRSTLRQPDRYQPGSYLLDGSDSENESVNVNFSIYKSKEIIEPKTYREAMNSEQRKEWMSAMEGCRSFFLKQ